MDTTPSKAYVYQPMPPQSDGRFYGVGGLHLFGLNFDEADIHGITKCDAEKLARACNQEPEKAAEFVRHTQHLIDHDWKPECGCRFESLYSSAVLLCESCSNAECHKGRTTR